MKHLHDEIDRWCKRAIAAESDANANRLKREELERELAATRAKLEGAQRALDMDRRSVCTPAERAVLDAAQEIPEDFIQAGIQEAEVEPDEPGCAEVARFLRAELARRGENPFAGVRASDWLRELREEDGEKP